MHSKRTDRQTEQRARYNELRNFARACVCVWMMDECFNFPPLESVMGDEPKMAREVRGSHQTCRQDNKAGKWAERKSGRGAGRCANVQGSGLTDECVSCLCGMIV